MKLVCKLLFDFHGLFFRFGFFFCITDFSPLPNWFVNSHARTHAQTYVFDSLIHSNTRYKVVHMEHVQHMLCSSFSVIRALNFSFRSFFSSSSPAFIRFLMSVFEHDSFEVGYIQKTFFPPRCYHNGVKWFFLCLRKLNGNLTVDVSIIPSQ